MEPFPVFLRHVKSYKSVFACLFNALPVWHDTCECRTTGTMDNWYHAIFDIGGQLGPSSYVKVGKWYHQVFPEWTTGTMPYLT